MDETLLSVGLDVGTTSTQMVVSELTVRNQASQYAVPELVIGDRKVVYESPVYFTPMESEDLIDGEGLRQIIEKEYARAGITRETVDTGAIIITGETSRKENAGRVLEALRHLAGDFVVATAGPDLESRLAAKGSGAVEYSRRTGEALLHMDIGGGTSNLALIENGEITDTGCLNVGGRLLRFDAEKKILYVSPALKPLTDLKPGEILTEEKAREIASRLAEILEMAAGQREPSEILEAMVTREGKLPDLKKLPKKLTLSFSGGVADCIREKKPWDTYGDLGPLLGQAIFGSRLCAGTYVLGEETIRATVIGAGCHTAQLSGSTVFYQNIPFPLQNLPVGILTPETEMEEPESEPMAFRLQGWNLGSYEGLAQTAEKLVDKFRGRTCILCLPQDAAKALGQALALRLPEDARILCLDRVALGENCYLDVGTPVGPAIPVVVKTLILKNQE